MPFSILAIVFKCFQASAVRPCSMMAPCKAMLCLELAATFPQEKMPVSNISFGKEQGIRFCGAEVQI